MGFLIRTAITAVALAAADYLLLGIEFVPTDLGLGAEGNKLAALVVSALALGILNALVRPILVVLSLPISCVTLGLFVVVINGVVLWLLTFIPYTGFVVHDLFAAILGALVVMVVSFALNLVVPGR
jgi:putative membrane protein